MRITFTSLLFFFNSFSFGQLAADKTDSLALVDLYNSTNGTNWIDNSGWLSGPVYTWKGIYMNGTGRVYEIYLDSNNLVGTLPSSIGNLSALEKIVFYKNPGLTGSIPDEIGHLGSLTYLYLGYNGFTGSIPVSVGQLANLTYLNAGANSLSDTLPKELGNLPLLQYLYMGYNQLTGTLPAEIGNLSSLIDFWFNNNNITGKLPPEFGSLHSLKTLYGGQNQLSGTIPIELGQLADLTVLSLYRNSLSGSIPAELGNLDSLQKLLLGENKLTGAIPAELGKLSKLYDLYLGYNQLTGIIPAQLGKLSGLVQLYLSDNQLTGPIPVEVAQLPLLSDVSIENNRFVFDEGMELIAGLPTTYYAPQAAVPIRFRDGGGFAVQAAGASSPADQSLQRDTFYWYRNGVNEVTTAADSTAAFAQLFAGDTVYAIVRNAVATELTLYSDTLIVGQVLPLTLLNFSAIGQADCTLLNWQTTGEINTDHFTVERSVDGIHYTAIGTIRAAGSSISHSYQYRDAALSSLSVTKAYYRLILVDKNGIGITGKIVAINLTDLPTSIKVWPNPARNLLQITIHEAAGNTKLQITDANGKIMWQQVKYIPENSSLSVNISAFPAGIYWLITEANGKRYSQKFVVE